THCLKGTAGVLAADKLRELAVHLEAAAQAGDLTVIAELVEQLCAEMQRCLDDIPHIRTRFQQGPESLVELAR
ncbi:MAG TPA: Hpt domain-containing protein, partial [Planctomycetaceae bacterium]|nr:Hpt domain-containing protein [Planctomycetaceae bacterium]